MPVARMAISRTANPGYFLQQNMGKQGLCIDLKDKRGLAMMHELVKTADVFVENYRPGALTKLGLGYAELSKPESAADLLLGLGLWTYRTGFRASPALA